MEERVSRKSFIRLGGALGVGAASASLLASCGGSGSSGNSGNSGSGSSGSQSTGSGGQSGSSGGGSSKAEASGGQVLAQESQVAPNSAVQFQNAGQPAVLVHLKGGDFVAYSAVCTHAGCTVAYQKSSGNLVCPCHGSVFDPAQNARVVQPPAPRPLPEIPIKIQGGKIFKA